MDDQHAWVYELVAEDDRVRGAALARHRALIAASRPGTLVELTNAFTASRFGPDAPGPEDRGRLARYAVLFLEWERRFPDEWRASWPHSPWSSKQAILATFTASGVTEETRPALEDLLLSAVHRRQRCAGGSYWPVARRLDSPPLRDRLRAAAGDADERTRLRARFVLWALDRPGANVGKRAWRRWMRDEGRPVTSPAPAAELSAMAPAAAAFLARMDSSDAAAIIARMLSSVSPAAARAAFERLPAEPAGPAD